MSPFTFSPFISSRIKYLDRVSVTFLFLFPHSDAWTSCHFSKEGHIWLTSKSRCWPWWAAGAGFNPCISSYTFSHNIQFLAVQMPLSFQRCTMDWIPRRRNSCQFLGTWSQTMTQDSPSHGGGGSLFLYNPMCTCLFHQENISLRVF